MAHVKLDVQLLRGKPEGVVQAQRHFTHRLMKDRGTVDALCLKALRISLNRTGPRLDFAGRYNINNPICIGVSVASWVRKSASSPVSCRRGESITISSVDQAEAGATSPDPAPSPIMIRNIRLNYFLCNTLCQRLTRHLQHHREAQYWCR